MKEIATKTTTTYILDKYKLHATKKFGQNFLIDTNIVEKIVQTGSIDKDTCVIEIGPGIGALTQVLSKYAGKVVSYEIDTRFKPVYEEFFSNSNVEIIFQDFLEVPLEEVVSKLKENYTRVCVVANLPYYITTKLIEKIVLSNAGVDSMVVMIQKEVAKKFTEDYKNPLTLMFQEVGSIEYAFTVSKNVFIPAPHVDSAVIKIKIDRAIDQTLYHLVTTAFTQRRKTIYNNLKDTYPMIEEILEKSKIEKNKRSEQLELTDFKEITKHL